MKSVIASIIILVVVFIGLRQAVSMDQGAVANARPDQNSKELRAAVFAGGCFWCTEADFEKVDGVVEVVSGYTGGHLVDPTYEQVVAGGTGHLEAVQVVYDPAKIAYEQLLSVFWQHIDPTDGGGQFVDRGDQYRSAIFYADKEEQTLAAESKKILARSKVFDAPIVTEILPLGPFYPAEAYHQNYFKRNPIRYMWYRGGSGRDAFLEKTWADKNWEEDVVMNHNLKAIPDDATLKSRLTPLQYEVTRRNATEPPFKNAYWDHHEAGIYVDIISGEPLFSSKDKFDSGTGWPSFTRPLVPENIVERTDRGFMMVRTEVRSKAADAHLGHVFNDGPAPLGLRYCINSAALRFVPRDDLEKEGYGAYAADFLQADR